MSLFSPFITVCRFRNLQGASSYCCFAPLWKGNCYLGPKAERTVGPSSTNLFLRALWLRSAIEGLGGTQLFCECLFLARRHTCTWSKSATISAFESRRMVRRKDVTGFETKIDVRLQAFFLQLPILICIGGGGWVYLWFNETLSP